MAGIFYFIGLNKDAFAIQIQNLKPKFVQNTSGVSLALTIGEV